MARGPSICLLCKNGNENSNHIFLTCSYTYQWWKELAAYLGFQQTDHTEVKEAIRWWGTQKVTLRSIPLLLFWYVWKKRNYAIFREGKGSHLPVSDQIISMYLSIISPFQKKNLPTKITDLATFQYSRWGIQGLFLMELHKEACAYVESTYQCLTTYTTQFIGMVVEVLTIRRRLWH